MSLYRGWHIYYDGKDYRYSDTKLLVKDTWKSRGCGFCGEPDTPDGHDACLGELPGVNNACCGHGVASHAYIQYDDGSIYSGKEAFARFREAMEIGGV